MNSYVPNTRYAFHQDGRLFCEGKGWAAVLRIWPEQTIAITHSGGHWAKPYESGTAPRDLGSRVLRLALDMADRPDFYGDVIDGPEDGPQLPLPGFIQFPIHRYLPGLEHLDDAFIHRAHLRCFLETLPPGLRALMAFPHYAPWQLLRVFTNCPRAGDLATANPLLFSYLLSHFLSTYAEEEPPYDRMDSWLDCRQVEIMEYLGLPASESDRRILMKTSHDATHWLDKKGLQLLAARPDLHRIVEHLPVLNDGVNLLLNDPAYYPHLTGPLLTEMAGLDDTESRQLVYTYALDAADLLRRAGWNDKRIYSIRALTRLHDELLQRIGPEGLMTESERNLPFPPPPYAGTAHILPLTRPEELFREGLEMKHCVAMHASTVAIDLEYIYRVTVPVRATLSIRRNESGQWALSQMQGKCNQRIDRRIVEDTLALLWASPAGETAAPRLIKDVYDDETADEIEDEQAQPEADDHTLVFDFDPQLPLLPREQFEIVRAVGKAFSGLATA